MAKKDTRIHIFDTTLRDGEQSPGVNLGVKEKLEIARQLAHLGVDIIEAGFPITSPGDASAVKEVAKHVRGVTICALARAVEKDMVVALDSLKPAKQKRLHVFLATSEIHRKYKLKKAKDEIEKLAVWAVKYARQHIGEVEFSPEDASRTERDFLYRIIEKTIDAGATIINIPDTVGYTTPYEFQDLIESIFKHVPNIHKATIRGFAEATAANGPRQYSPDPGPGPGSAGGIVGGVVPAHQRHFFAIKELGDYVHKNNSVPIKSMEAQHEQ